MKLRTIKYYIKEGFIGLFKNRLMTLASLGTISACIFIVILSVCVAVNLQHMLFQLRNSIGLTVFVQDDISETRFNNLELNLKSIDHVKTVTYISPQEALQKLKEDWGDDQAIWAGLEDDDSFSLSKSFKLELDDSVNSSTVIRAIESLEDVKSVSHAEDEIGFLTSLNQGVSLFCTILIAILCIVSVVIVMNTIKLTVYVRRKEINIMKYVGATDWFIRWPFIIEGMLIGLIAAFIPSLVCWIGYGRIIGTGQEGGSSLFDIVQNAFSFKQAGEIFPILLPVCLLMGFLLGTAGSIYSIRRHLNV